MRDLVRAAGLLPLILLAPLLAGCPGRAGPGSLRVASVRQPATSLFYVAQAAGCFEREGLRVEEQAFDLGRDAMRLLHDGRADVAIAYEAVVVRAAEADPRLRILSALHHSTRNTRLVTRAAAGVAGFADLAGKRVGLARGTNADFFVGLALRFGGVPREAVEIVDLPPERSAEALATGTLDAAVLSDPSAAGAEHALAGEARVLHNDLYVEFSLLATRDELVAARGPALAALVRGLACGERFARERRAEALAAIGARFPELGPDELARQVERVVWAVGLDHVLLETLRRERDALAPRAPEPRSLLEPRFLEEAEPEAVMLLPVVEAPR